MRPSRTNPENSTLESLSDSLGDALNPRPPLSRLRGFRGEEAPHGLALSCIATSSSAPIQSSLSLRSRVGALSRDFNQQNQLGGDSLESLSQLTVDKIRTQSTTLTAQIQPRDLTQISRQQLQLATSSGGSLSMARHAQISAKMDQEVDLALEQLKSKNKRIQDLIDQHVSQLTLTRVKLSERFNRLIEALPSEEGSEEGPEKFLPLIQVAYNMLDYHDKIFKSAVGSLNAVNISEEAKEAIDLILNTRQKDIQIFSMALDIIRKHEVENFQMQIQAYEVKMREQEILFKSYFECRELQQEELRLAKEFAFKARAQEHQENVDKQKLEIEQQIVVFAHEANKLREKNQLALESLRIQTEGSIQCKGLEMQKSIQMRSLDLDEKLGKQQIKAQMAMASQAIRSEERSRQAQLEAQMAMASQALQADERNLQAQLGAQMAEMHIQGQLEHHRISVDGRVKAIEAQAQERVGVAQAIASASPCSIM